MTNFEQEWPVVIRTLKERANTVSITPKQKAYRVYRWQYTSANRAWFHFCWGDVFICPYCCMPENSKRYHKEQKHICSECEHWQQIISELKTDEDKYIVIDEELYGVIRGCKYSTEEYEEHGYPKLLRSFKRHDNGKTVELAKLWNFGIIPFEWREQLPDNAVFV